MRRITFVVAVAAVWLGAACSSAETVTPPANTPAPDVPSAAAPTSPPASAPSAAPSATALLRAQLGNGCNQPLPTGVALGRTTVRQVSSAGIERLYRLHLPPNLSMAKPAAVVLNFHGLGSNAIEQEAYSGLSPVSDREGFILVSPDGTGSPRAWASSPNLPTGVDDVLFTKDLLDRLQTDLCVDTTRIYSTGMSNGAFMSSRLACVLSDRIAAAAPVAGVGFAPAERCGKPVAILAFHGTADRTVPFEEGLIFNVLLYAGARKSTADWASHNGCGPTPELSKVSEAVTRESYPKCGGADVTLVVVKGGGHTWPGASIEIGRLGETTKDVSATEEIWKFFAAHPLIR